MCQTTIHFPVKGISPWWMSSTIKVVVTRTQLLTLKLRELILIRIATLSVSHAMEKNALPSGKIDNLVGYYYNVKKFSKRWLTKTGN